MNGPLRRRIDERPAAAAVRVPAPTGDQVSRAELPQLLGDLLDSAQHARRSVTLVVVEARGLGAPPDDLCSSLAPIVRESDVVWRTGPRTAAMVLVDADGPSGEAAVSRIRAGMAARSRLGLALGRATAAPGIAAGELIDLATANLLGVR